ncbi:uncharacterized protein J3R85_019733 [Psidium guajava]|nr:uncharacterized protein J3R85_019733 [Psidium guajava]
MVLIIVQPSAQLRSWSLPCRLIATNDPSDLSDFFTSGKKIEAEEEEPANHRKKAKRGNHDQSSSFAAGSAGFESPRRGGGGPRESKTEEAALADFCLSGMALCGGGDCQVASDAVYEGRFYVLRIGCSIPDVGRSTTPQMTPVPTQNFGRVVDGDKYGTRPRSIIKQMRITTNIERTSVSITDRLSIYGDAWLMMSDKGIDLEGTTDYRSRR